MKGYILAIVLSLVVGGTGSFFIWAFPARKSNSQIRHERNDFEEKYKNAQVSIDSSNAAGKLLAEEKNKYIAFSDSMIGAINKRSPGIVLIKNYEDSIVGSLDVMAQLRAYSNFLAQTDSL